MYDNIGKKLKELAKVFFLISLIGFIITGCALMVIDGDFSFIGIIVMIAGALFSWVSTWFLYGFGELVEKVCDIEKNQKLESLYSNGMISKEDYQKSLTGKSE